MRIRYYQKDGKIRATYSISHEQWELVRKEGLIRPFPAEDPFMEEIDIGFIPEKVITKGKEEIYAYAFQASQERHELHLVQQRKVRDECRHRMENVNRVISTHHQGKILKGRIVKNTRSEHGGLFVTLEEPFVSKQGGVIRGCRGFRIFDHEGNLTSDALSASKGMLVSLYNEEMNRQKHGEVVKLVEALNGLEEE
jgi:hypothetical protein